MDFPVEAAQRLGIGQPVLADQLQRHDPVERALPGLEDRPHAALA